MTLREAISRVKKEIKEVNADSRLTNKFIYSKLISKGNLIIQRDSNALKLGNLQDLYQTLKCLDVKEVPAIDKNCFLTTDYTLFRTCNRVPDLYSDVKGVIIKSIRTLDRNEKITLETLDYIQDAARDSNSKYDKSIYAFYEDGYIYQQKRIPIRVEGMFVHDVTSHQDCACDTSSLPCKRFLDTKWYMPRKLEDDVISLVIRDLSQTYERLPGQTIIDKNPTT